MGGVGGVGGVGGITNYQLPITNYQLPITHTQNMTIINLKENIHLNNLCYKIVIDFSVNIW